MIIKRFLIKNGDFAQVCHWVLHLNKLMPTITGRAFHILTHTLPTFFSTGLVTTCADAPINLDTQTQSPTSMDQIDIDSIYSPDIHLSYTPPVALPAPFPQTL